MHLDCLQLKWLFFSLFLRLGWDHILFFRQHRGRGRDEDGGSCLILRSGRAGGTVVGFFLWTNHSHWLKLQPPTFVRCVIIFCYSQNSIFSLIKPNQLRPAAGNRDLPGGRLLVISEATLKVATLFMPIIPSGVGVNPLMSNTPVFWSSLFLFRHHKRFFFSLTLILTKHSQIMPVIIIVIIIIISESVVSARWLVQSDNVDGVKNIKLRCWKGQTTVWAVVTSC